MRSRTQGTALAITALILGAAGASSNTGAMAVAPLDTAVPSAVSTRVNSAGDEVYVDASGREILLRGYAVSAETKIAENGFLPFRSTEDAARAFEKMRTDTGAGVIRFQLSWEGVEPQPGRIDREYLKRAAGQIKEATARGIRVIVEYHSDLMARGIFRPDSRYTGNGMPNWVIDKLGLTGRESCFGCVTWGQHNLSDNSGARPAARAFWENAEIDVNGEKIGVQDVFVRQLQQVLPILRGALSDEDASRVVGVEPVNEPFDGGMGDRTPAQWENELLWPFYNRVRSTMDEQGWTGKLLFAEPNVFWDSRLGPIAPPLGLHADPKPVDRIVFTPHLYDNARQLPWAEVPGNGDYFELFGAIRDGARQLETPTLVSEFGIQVGGTGPKDSNRQIQGMYQAMQAKDNPDTEDPSDLAEYAPILSSTQWHWDIYRGRHHELVNGNPDRVETEGDAWNGEDYSVVQRNDAGQLEYTVDRANVQRIHPQASQGEMLNFAYNTRATDADGKRLNWLTLSSGDGQEYFKTSSFASLTWKGRHSQAPTELFIPPQIDPASTAVITDSGVHNGLPVDGPVRYVPNQGGGGQLLYWTDPNSIDPEARHFAVVVPDAPRVLAEVGAMTPKQQQTKLEEIQQNLVRTVGSDHVNAVRLTDEDR